MPSKKKAVQAVEAVEEKHIEQPVNDVKPKKTRVMTEEMLEKLKKARELALKARKQKAEIDAQHKEIKETWGQKVDNVETFKKLKEKAKEEADVEVKKHEIVNINKKLEDLYGRFDGYLQEKTVRRQQKEQAKQERKTSEIVNELPAAMSKKLLDERLKELEIERWRKRYFGL